MIALLGRATGTRDIEQTNKRRVNDSGDARPANITLRVLDNGFVFAIFPSALVGDRPTCRSSGLKRGAKSVPSALLAILAFDFFVLPSVPAMTEPFCDEQIFI
jgi:hypothetical protein